MNTAELLLFIPRCSQADFLKYCMITAAMAKHYLYNEFVCWNLSDTHIKNYNNLITELKQKYCYE